MKQVLKLVMRGPKHYSLEQVGKTMTVKELIDELSCYDEDMEVVLHLNQRYGVQYEEITLSSIEEEEIEDEEYEEED